MSKCFVKLESPALRKMLKQVPVFWTNEEKNQLIKKGRNWKDVD